MVYLVGVPDPHIAIGTSAFAVAANAATNLVNHARRGNVKWALLRRSIASQALSELLPAPHLAKPSDGQKLLFLFAFLMLLVGILMFRRRGDEGNAGAECTLEKSPKVLGYGALTGLFSGFFGIGGGFLIVPGLVASTGMPILNAIGSSLVAVTAFGLTTSANYAISGFVDWPLAIVFVAGGIGGGMIGTYAACHLSSRKGVLTIAFAGLIFAVALYMIWRSAAMFIT